MSENKYQPPVNMPENVPGNAANPGTLIVQFLHTSGQWIGCTGDQLMLRQMDDNTIALCSQASPGKVMPLVSFPGKLVLTEQPVVIP